MEQKQINLLISGIIILLIFGVFKYLISPKYQEVVLKNDEIDRLEKEIESINDYYVFAEANFQKLKNAGWEQKQKFIEVNFTSSPFFFPKVHHLLRTLASQNGLTVSNITNSNPVEISRTQEEYKDSLEGPVKKTNFKLSLSGNYESLENLLLALEKQTRIATVKSVSVLPFSRSRNEKSFPEDFYNFDLAVDFYSY